MDKKYNGIPLKCHKCGHEFFYKGKLRQATCSSCGAKVKVPEEFWDKKDILDVASEDKEFVRLLNQKS